jgi:hypothetical protein
MKRFHKGKNTMKKMVIRLAVLLNALTFSANVFAGYPVMTISVYNNNPVTWSKLSSILLENTGSTISGTSHDYTYQQISSITIQPDTLQDYHATATIVLTSPDHEHWCEMFINYYNNGSTSSYTYMVNNFGSNCRLNTSSTSSYNLTLIMS